MTREGAGAGAAAIFPVMGSLGYRGRVVGLAVRS